MADKLRVLVLEDEFLLASMISDILEDNAYQVSGVAKDIHSALAVVNEKPLDLAILDYNLAEETCMPVAEKLREKTIPFIILSGNTDTDFLSDQFPDVTVMTKPFREAKLVETLSSVVAQAYPT